MAPVHELRPGIHLLIKRTQAPIVPVGIAGAFEAMPQWRTLPVPAPLFLPAQRTALAVSVGRPLNARHFAERPPQEAGRLARLFAELQNVAGALAGARLRPQAIAALRRTALSR